MNHHDVHPFRKHFPAHHPVHTFPPSQRRIHNLWKFCLIYLCVESIYIFSVVNFRKLFHIKYAFVKIDKFWISKNDLSTKIIYLFVNPVHFPNATLNIGFILISFSIRDGPDQTSPQIGQFSGNTALESVYSTSNQILIKFHSDFTTSGFFVLSYHGKYNTHLSLLILV